MIGMGLMGSKHCQAILSAATRFDELRADPPRLVVCADESADQVEEAKALYGFERAAASWQEVIRADDVDLVMICSPNGTHARFAQAAGEAGKNVFCEKPVGRSPEETRLIADSAARNGVRSMVGYVYRWAPMTRYAQQLVAKGVIGDVTHYRGRFLVGYGRDPATPLSWRFEEEEAGFGALGDLMSHVLDMSHFMAGKIREVVADTHTFIGERPIPARSESHVFGARATDRRGPVTNDDYATALIRFENGGRGHLEACRVINGPVCRMAFDVHGTEGAISWNLERMNELVIMHDSHPDSERTILSGPGHPGQAKFWPGPGVGIGYEDIVSIQAAAMIHHMETGEGWVPTFEDARYVANAQEAMMNSSVGGRWERISD
ncbi:MAG: Gfo/Idh/MocA family oxidoreductase [bacterium]|nr:Gfo/Idh/MocA family oxidoreductase [bacterium]MDE0500891.1 Gfo/Idh/MocA family oxidoreductase [bacterium]